MEDQEEAGDQRAPPITIDGKEAYRVRGDSGLSSLGQNNSVPCGLGGVRPGGTVLGQ